MLAVTGSKHGSSILFVRISFCFLFFLFSFFFKKRVNVGLD